MEIKTAVEFDKETTADQYPGTRGIGLSPTILSLEQYAILFQSMGLFRELTIGYIIQFFQQFTSINAIIYKCRFPLLDMGSYLSDSPWSISRFFPVLVLMGMDFT